MKSITLLVLGGLLIGLMGCSSVNTYPKRVRAGETVVLSAGWMHHFSRDNLTVTVTPDGGVGIPVTPDHVRASINFYPDPLSSLVLAPQVGQDISTYSLSYGGLVTNAATSGDRDWWESFVFVDIPDTTPAGGATVSISNPEGEVETARIEVFDSGGSQEEFEADLLPVVLNEHLRTLERVDHFVVSFNGTTVPYAVQIDLDYSSDVKGHIVNPKGEIKNLNWADNGDVYRVIITPAKQSVTSSFLDITDLKFYVAIVSGTDGVADVSVVPNSVLAFDETGNMVTGVSAEVSLVRGVAGLN